MKKLILLSSMIGLTSCATIHNVSVSSFAHDNETLVSAETTGTGFLRLVTPELEINRQLREQCLNGVVNGIQTTLTSQEFILIQVYTLKAVGYCSKK